MSYCRTSRLLLPATLLIVATGCSTTPVTARVSRPAGFTGAFHGGQQPVAGALIQLYAVGTTGDASPATPLLPRVTTDNNGNFTFDPICPTGDPLTYLVATGGSPANQVNPNIAAMLAIGPCSSITPSSFYNINEVTTVAALYPLAPYIASYAAVGASPAHASALASAFALAATYADVSTGYSPGPSVPAGYTVPVAQIDTIANILSACFNSAGGTFGDNSLCGRLFSLTYPGTGVQPADTVAALINLANHPTLNTPSLFSLVPPGAPFQPMDTSTPPDLSVHLLPASSVTLSPAPLSFAAATVNFIQSLAATISNGSGTAITISSFSIGGTNAADFALDPAASTCGPSLASGSTCTEQVVFTPQATGSRSASLQLNSSASTPAAPLSLLGSGVAPTNPGPITLSPTSSTLPLTSVPQILTLTNAGSVPLTIDRIVLSETNIVSSGSPAVTNNFFETNDCGPSLPAQASCTIKVIEATGGPTGYSIPATVTVFDDAASGPQSATVTYAKCAGYGCLFGQTVGTISSLRPGFYVGYAGRGNGSSYATTLAGPMASDFAFGDGTPLGAPAAFGTCDSSTGGCSSPSFYFKPAAVGLRTATFATPFGNQTLLGWGVSGPTLNLISPSGSFSFQPATVGSYAVTLDGTVENDSGTSLTLKSPTIIGADAAIFTVDANTNYPNCKSAPVLANGASCTFKITAAPTRTGINRAAAVFSDSTGAALQILPLVVTASPPPPHVTQLAQFPNTQPGPTSPVVYLSISSNSDPVSVTFNSYPAGAIQFSGPSQCSQTPCQIGFIFTPADFGSAFAYIAVTDTLSHLSSSYNLSATSTQVAQITVSPSSYNFPLRAVGTNSIAQNFTISATNATGASFSQISLGKGTDYALTGNTCSPALQAFTSCTLSVSFAPKSPGTLTDTLTITSSAASSPDVIHLSGTAQ